MVNNKYKETLVVLSGNSVKLENGIMFENDMPYISFSDLKALTTNQVYYDKIARKLVITSGNIIAKVKLNSSELSINFGKNIEQHMGNLLVEKSGEYWLNLDVFGEAYNKEIYTSKVSNTIYIENKELLPATLKNNRVFIYGKNKSGLSVITCINKEDKVEVINNPNENKDGKWIKIIAQVKGSYATGYILKEQLKFDESKLLKEPTDSVISNDKMKVMIVREQNTEKGFDEKVVNILNIDALEINDSKGNLRENYTKKQINNMKSDKYDIYASVSNDYKASNYDNTILSNMLGSELNRETCIKNVLQYSNEYDLDGIVVNLRNIKTDDEEMFVQYVKEISVYLHANNKKVIVNLTNGIYSHINEISKYADNVVLLEYAKRTISSNNSGSHSSVKELQKTLNTVLKSGVDSSKLILEIPTYSILWTEKNAQVINAEIYNMSAVKSYVKSNNLKITIDDSVNQNYVSFEKGQLTYKMWLEDELSITNKVQLAKNLKLGGISVYKSGYETSNIYSVIKESIK